MIVFLLLLLGAVMNDTSARDVISINTGWQFKKGPFSTDPMRASAQWDGKWEEVTIPHTWNAKDMQVKADAFYEGVGYYRKKQFFGNELAGKRVFLRFEGVGACTEVYVNGKLVGTHKGGYSAFVFEIGTALKLGAENEIIVKADNTARPDVIPVNHSLFGVYGGIYRPVWLITTEQNNITVTDCASPGVYITQKNVSRRSADITVKVKLDNGSLAPAQLVLENSIYTQEGKKVVSQRLPLELTPQGTQSYVSTFKLKNPHLWQGREDPYLYKVVSRLLANGEVIDEVTQPLEYTWSGTVTISLSSTSTSSTPVPDQGIHGTSACWATIVEEILSPSERIAEPGGPMKTIFFGEAASDSGNLGFSEACPLSRRNR